MSWGPVLAVGGQLAACAAPGAAVEPPRLSIPSAASEPCTLTLLPPDPSTLDLEIAFAARGAALVSCDARRQLAVGAATTQQEMIDAWLRDGREPRPWWSLFSR